MELALRVWFWCETLWQAVRFRVSALIRKICAFCLVQEWLWKREILGLENPQRVFFSETLSLLLHIGSYNNASCAELLKAQNVTRILNVRASISISPFSLESRKFGSHLFHDDDPIAYQIVYCIYSSWIPYSRGVLLFVSMLGQPS
jgi:hypothetical protein